MNDRFWPAGIAWLAGPELNETWEAPEVIQSCGVTLLTMYVPPLVTVRTTWSVPGPTLDGFGVTVSPPRRGVTTAVALTEAAVASWLVYVSTPEAVPVKTARKLDVASNFQVNVAA